MHLGGYNRDGSDATNPVSYLVLEAVHRLKLPSNVGVCVGKGLDRNLLRKSVEYQFADKNGNPRFVGMETLVRGLVRNEGVSIRGRAHAHEFRLPLAGHPPGANTP